ncbi:hypothetical protein [Flavobacterium soyangense]|nr:hypothetical protein [Flavobacterium soyangense]
MEHCKEKTAIRHLITGLKNCYPISYKLLMRLLERVVIHSD